MGNGMYPRVHFDICGHIMQTLIFTGVQIFTSQKMLSWFFVFLIFIIFGDALGDFDDLIIYQFYITHFSFLVLLWQGGESC